MPTRNKRASVAVALGRADTPHVSNQPQQHLHPQPHLQQQLSVDRSASPQQDRVAAEDDGQLDGKVGGCSIFKLRTEIVRSYCSCMS